MKLLKRNSLNRSRKNRKERKKFSLTMDFSKANWDKAEKIFAYDYRYIRSKIEKEERPDLSAADMLKFLAGGSIIALSFIFSALPMALAPFILDGKRLNRGHFNQRIDRLKQQKLVEIIEDKNGTMVRITDKGKMRALRYKLAEMQVKRPKIWDRKWRIVIFDIPEKYKRARDIFRQHLKAMGFCRLQESVWVHPYPCFDEIEFLRQIYKVGISVTYILAERIENPQNLKEYFYLD